MASVSLFHYSPTPHFDLFAFELKMEDGCGAPAVMQAASYSEFSHHTYVGIYLPEGSSAIRNLSTMIARAQPHGVGIIKISDPFNDNGHEILMEATRNTPHPGQIDKFIEERFTVPNKNALKKWVCL